MRELSRGIAVLCVVFGIVLVVTLAGAAANVTVGTNVTIIDGTDVLPSPADGGGTGGSSGGGGESGDSSGGDQTPLPADVADDEANVDAGVSVWDTGGRETSFEADPLKNASIMGGNLTCLACEGEAAVGNVLRIAGVFRNSGPVDTNATLVGNVFRNGAFIGVIGGEKQTVRGGTEENLSMNLTLGEPGDYLVRAHVVYGGKMSEVSEMSFLVPDKDTLPFLFPFVGVVLLVAVSAAVRWRRRNS